MDTSFTFIVGGMGMGSSVKKKPCCVMCGEPLTYKDNMNTKIRGICKKCRSPIKQTKLI